MIEPSDGQRKLLEDARRQYPTATILPPEEVKIGDCSMGMMTQDGTGNGVAPFVWSIYPLFTAEDVEAAVRGCHPDYGIFVVPGPTTQGERDKISARLVDLTAQPEQLSSAPVSVSVEFVFHRVQEDDEDSYLELLGVRRGRVNGLNETELNGIGESLAQMDRHQELLNEIPDLIANGETLVP